MKCLRLYFTLGLCFFSIATFAADNKCSLLLKNDPAIEMNNFHTQRSYEAYLKVFKGILLKEIQSQKALHFVDFGAGEGHFAEDLAKQGLHHVSMISYKVRRTITENSNLKVFKGEYFENLTREALTKDFGKFDVVVDYWGILAYSLDPGSTLQKLKSLCNSDVRILVMSRGSKHQKVSDLTNAKIKTQSGELLTLPDWLAAQPGLKVTDHRGFLVIQFDKAVEFAPKKLKLIEYKETEKVPGLFWGTNDEIRMPAARTFVEYAP